MCAYGNFYLVYGINKHYIIPVIGINNYIPKIGFIFFLLLSSQVHQETVFMHKSYKLNYIHSVPRIVSLKTMHANTGKPALMYARSTMFVHAYTYWNMHTPFFYLAQAVF